MPSRSYPRVLWVSEERPDRGLGGGSIRQAHLLEVVARAMPVDLLVTGRVTDERVRAAARTIIELDIRLAITPEHPIVRRLHWLAVALTYPRPWYAYGAGPRRRAVARRLRALHRDYDVICVEHATMAPVIPRARSGRWILTLHQIVSAELRQELEGVGRRRRRWLLSRDLAKALALERRALDDYDGIAVCSDADAETVIGLDPPRARGRVAVVPNGVDLDTFAATPVPAAPRVLFPGSFHFPPNIHGAEWLVREIWPRVRTAVPAATLELVGRDPDPRVRALAGRDGVAVIADVPSMAPYFEAARAVAVPLLVGSGTRLKATEAMSSGRPLVGTSVGLQGLAITDGVEARIADDAEAFSRALVEVLTDDALAARLGAAGRARAEERFGWDRIGRDYAELIIRLAEPAVTTGALRAGASGISPHP